MLDQRNAEEKGYITLKEAAQIANYSPDYVGQLIRAGKIRGEQVYSQIAWMTTRAEIESYLQNKGRHATVRPVERWSVVLGRGALYLLIIVLAGCLLGLQYILYIAIDKRLSSPHRSSTAEVEVVPIHDQFGYD